MQSGDNHPLPEALPGQYVVVRLNPTASGPVFFRSYSLSGPPATEHYRISVKIEPNGAARQYLSEHLGVGDRLDVSSPRGSFVLQSAERPIVLLSAGIGATPVLAMLQALAAAHSTRQVMWLHSAHDGQHHPFASEVRVLMRALTNGCSYICYTKPDSNDKTGKDFDATGRFSRSVFDELELPREADVYLCGPTRFMADMKEALTALGVAPERVHIEIFNGGESMTPGVVGAATRAPHPPSNEASSGPLVSFARSGISAHWEASRYPEHPRNGRDV
jgi:ferredoxin-NADP reductase